MSGDGVNRVNSARNTSTENHVDGNHTSGGSQGNTIIENQSGGSQGNTSPQNQSGTQKIIIFNEYGQPVDIGSTQFSSAIGKIAKAHCPPGIEDWRRVPKNIKEDIWKSVKNAYQVPEIYKDKILKKANSAWRNWKGELRKICDRAETVAERKSIVVEDIKKEDWEAFVELHSTDEDQARRDSGRNARKMVKILHTTGRKGCARVAHELKKTSPTGEVNRSVLYLATHLNTSKNDPTRVTQSTSGFEYLEKIKRLIDEDPYLGEKDLDNDAVAMVLGRDGKGYVHGMGQGVSKTEIRASAASREISRREKKKNDALLNRIENLEETVASLQTVGCNTPRSSQSSSQFHTASPSAGHDHSTLPIKTCLLKNFRKKAVAIGRVNTDASFNDEAYNIIVDEIFDGNEMLFDRDGKFDDITVGEMINWPKYSVQFVRF